MAEIIGGILVIVFFVMLIGLVLSSTGISIGVGLFIAVFAGIFSAIKSCVIGVKKNVSNMFMKILLFIIIGAFVLAVAAGIGYVVYLLVMMFI